jgi:hypothetical protein
MNPNNEFIFAEDNYEYLTINDISEIDIDEDLIDISVEDDSTFCITDSSIVSHNCKSMMRTLTYKAAKAKVPILFSNHIYEGMEMFPTLVKTQSGGKGPIYLASVLVQLSTKNEKASDNPDEQSIAIAHNVSGVTLGALTVKNRFVPSYLKTELYLNFKSGLDKHAGLFEIAEAFSVIEKPGRTVMYKGESLGYRKDLEKDPAFWEKIMPELEKTLQEKLCYGENTTKVEEIEEEVEEI